MKTIRVAMLMQYYFRESTGGAERQVASLAPFLKEQNIEIHIISRHRQGIKAPDYEQEDNVSIYRSPNLLIRNLSSSYYTLFALQHLKRIKPNVAHAHGLFSTTTAALLGKRLFNIPVVAKVLRGGTLGDVHRVKSKAFGHQRIQSIGKNIDGLIVISNEIQNELIAESISKDKCHFIPNGVDIKRFKPLSAEEKQARRSAMGINHDPIVIYVGRLVPAKRVNNLIKSWQAIQPQFPNAQLLIIGKGAEQKDLEAMADDSIRFVGAVDNVPDWLQIADLYVLPSVAEGLSNSLLEAMSSALPIIATAVGDAPQLIINDKNGWCIPPDNIDVLTNALSEAFNNRNQMISMGEKSRERILKDYQLEATAKKLRQLYETVSNI